MMDLSTGACIFQKQSGLVKVTEEIFGDFNVVVTSSYVPVQLDNIDPTAKKRHFVILLHNLQ